MDKPAPLFLIVLGGLGTALLSPVNVGGIPLFYLAVPLAILATMLHNAEAGIVVGVGTSIVSGILVNSIELWDMLGIGLAAAVVVLAYDAVYPKQKTDLSAILFAVLGALLVEFSSELTTRENILFRPELFLGTHPALGLQILANVFVMGLLLTFYNTGKK